ncbi:MAG: CDF family Co(II)/Ni(II) efflux transporter DmeF [Rhodospirillaceae bacterium]
MTELNDGASGGPGGSQYGALGHRHLFLGSRHHRNERRTLFVIAITTVMMVGEIVAGTIFGSMALVADGWHMATHAGALAITAAAYLFARSHADDPRFSFGTAKLGDLAGFASAIILGVVSVLIAVEAGSRLVQPVPIAFDEAIMVAVLGLAVNLASAWLLQDHGHDHGHGHDHNHAHSHAHEDDHKHGRDHNLRAAYAHVLTDALTSVTAIVGLLAGRIYGWVWMDPMMAVIGSLVIAAWSFRLISDSGAALLDITPDHDMIKRVRVHLERDGDRITDLHLWRLGPGHLGLIVSLESNTPRSPAEYKARLSGIGLLSHITIEVQGAGVQARLSDPS